MKCTPTRQSRSLIEFPGARNAMPQWRKELGERVREVQERRLRETALENAATEEVPGTEPADQSKAPLLELLPQAEASPLNPLVVAALRRIERAHVAAPARTNFGNFSPATAVAYAEQPEYSSELASFRDNSGASAVLNQEDENSARAERVHSLAVVPDLPSEPVREPSSGDAHHASPSQKPNRLIGGDINDPALNYLDTIPTAPRLDDCAKQSAPIALRVCGSLIDLVVIGLLSMLPLALVTLTDLAWQDWRAITFAIGVAVVVAFLYLTICTAFTGRTLGMKLFSLRVVDARTRMLPTGNQSAGRAIVFLLSLALTGIPLVYTLIDRDKRAAHDRFTRTEVVRM